MQQVFIVGGKENNRLINKDKRPRRFLRKLIIFSVFLFLILLTSTGAVIALLKTGGLNKLLALDLQRQSPSYAGVLAAETQSLDQLDKIQFDIPAVFNQDVTVNGKATFNNDISIPNHNLDLGTGQLTASNVLYNVVAGDGLSSTGGQTPTITNTGVLSLQGKTGAVTLTAGSGISISGTTITNSSQGGNAFGTITSGGTSLSAGSTNDTLTFTAGNGISISPDTSNKKLTIADSFAPSSFTANGVLYADTSSSFTSLTPGTSGYVLQSNGSSAAPSWVAQSGIVAGSVAFNNITSGTNTQAAMIVGIGASLNFTGTGTINASTLLGNTWAAPGTIGSTTANTGAFTTLSASSLISANGGLTLASGQNFTLSGFTSGSIPFINSSNQLAQDNSNFFWDATNHRLGIGTTTPSALLDVNGTASISGQLSLYGIPTIQSTAYQTLTIGGDSTGNIVLSPKNSTGVVGLNMTPITGAGIFNVNGGITSMGSGNYLQVADSTTALNYAAKLFYESNSTIANASLLNDFRIRLGGLAQPTGFGISDRDTAMRFWVARTGNVSIGTTSALATFDVRANSGTIPIASFSGQTSFASLVVDNSGVGDIFTASSSGLNRFVITQNGNVGVGTTTPTAAFDLEVNTGSNALALLNQQGTGDIIDFQRQGVLKAHMDQFGNMSAISFKSQSNSAYFLDPSAANSSNSLLIRGYTGIGMSTNPQAMLDVRGTIGGTGTIPIASFSGTTSFAGFVVDNAGVGDLFTASSSGLNRFVITQNGNVGIGTTTPGALLDVEGNVILGTSTSNTIKPNGKFNGSLFASSTSVNIGSSNNSFGTVFGTNGYFTSGLQLGTNTLTVGTGTTPVATISGKTSFASLIIDQTGVGDIFTASVAGLPKFAIFNNGNIGFAGTNSVLSTIASSATSAQTWTFPNATGTVCLSGQSCAVSGTVGYWQRTASGSLNYLSPSTNTDLLAIGGTTGNATADIKALSGTLPVASISGATSLAGLIVDNSGVGDLFTASSSGLNRFVIAQGGNVGIGTTTPTAKLNISDTSFSDNFNRADSSSLGGNWTKRTDAGTDYQIVSNQLKLTAVDAGTHAYSAYTSQGISGADYSVQADITFPNSSDNWIAVFGRGSTFGADDSQGYYGFAEMSANKVYIYKRSSGSWTQIGSATFTLSASTPYTLKLVMSGTNLYLYVNGTLEVAKTDSTFSSAGFAGVAVGSPYVVNSIWDNFAINANTASFNVNGNMAVNGNGWIGIGTTNPSYSIDVQNGNINDAGNLYVSGSEGIGTSNPLATLDIRPASGTTAVASISGATSLAGLIVDNSGLGDILTASSSGLSRFVITQNGNVGVGTTTPTTKLQVVNPATSNQDLYVNILNSNNTYQARLDIQSTKDWALISQGSGSGFNSNFQIVDNGIGTARMSFDTNGDIGINANSPAGILDVRGVGNTTLNGIIPVASISGKTSFASMVVDNSGIGDIFTASSSGLNRFVITQNGNVGIGTTTPVNKLDVNGSVGIGSYAGTNTGPSNGLIVSGNVGVGTNNPNGIFEVSSNNTSVPLGLLSNTTAAVTDGLTTLMFAGTSGDTSMARIAAGWTAANTNNAYLAFNVRNNNGAVGNNEVMRIDNLGNVAINTKSPLALLDVRGTNGTNTISGTLPVASISGKTSFASLVVDNSGAGDLFTASSSGLNRFVITQNGNVGIGTSTPATFVDLRLSGNNTGDMMRFGNITSGTWSLLGIRSNGAFYINGSSSTPLSFGSNNVTDRIYLDNSGNVGVNAGQTPKATLDVRSTIGTTPIASFSGATSFASLVVDNSGVGDLFTASSSGLNRFVVTQNGNVGVGTTTPGEKLQIAGGNIELDNGQFIAFKDNTGSERSTLSWNSSDNLQLTNGNANNDGSVQIGMTNSNNVNGKIQFFTENAERLRIAPSGLIGINTTSPLGVVDVRGIGTNTLSGTIPVASFSGQTSFAGLVVDNSGTGELITASSSGKTRFFVDTIGNVGLADSTRIAFTDGAPVTTGNFSLYGSVNGAQTVVNAPGASGVTSFDINNIEKMRFDNNGNLGIGTTAPTDKLDVEGGNIMIGQQTNTGQANEQTWTKVTQSTAGTIASGGSFNIASISAMAVYNGSLYVGTYGTATGSAEIYRYNSGDGSGTSWSKVSQPTPGTIASGGTTAIASVSAMIVYNGYLYAGTSKKGAAEVYRYNGGTSWTVVNTTAGTFDSFSNSAHDGVSAMTVYNGELWIGTAKTAGARMYRYLGGTGASPFATQGSSLGSIDKITAMASYDGNLFLGSTTGDGQAALWRYGSIATMIDVTTSTTFCGSAALGVFCIIGSGTNDTGITAITSMAVYNGRLYMGLRKFGGGGDVVYLDQSGFTAGNSNPSNLFERAISAQGTVVSGGTSSIDSISALAVYNGKLYAGTEKAGAAEIYRYEGGIQDPSNSTDGTKWIKVSQATAGTIASAGTSGINMISYIIPYNGNLYTGTGTSQTEMYSYNVVSDQSYALKFHAGASEASGEQNNLLNIGSISFIASQSALTNTTGNSTGTFVFSHGITTNFGAYDVAEDYATRDDSLEPGDIVAMDPNEQQMVKKAGVNDSVVGIYSEKPGFRLSQQDTTINGGRAIPIALAGRVPVKVSTENGPIHIGDLLTISSTAGVAMKATKPGFMIARAFENYSCPVIASDSEAISNGIATSSSTPRNDVCQGKVMAFVSITWANPSVQLTSNGNLNIATTLTSEPNIPVTDNPLTPGSSTTAVLADNTSLATSSATTNISTSQLEAEVFSLQVQVSSQSSQLGKIDDLSKQLSDLEKQVNLLQLLQGTGSQSGNTTIDNDMTIGGKFSVLGRTLMSDLSVTGKISSGLLVIDGLDSTNPDATPSATINTLSGPLKIQSLALSGVDFLNGKVVIDINGNINVNADITANKLNINPANNKDSSAGKGTVLAGTDSVDVNTSAVTPDSLINITFTNDYAPATRYWIDRKKAGKSFTVKLDDNVLKDASFTWWIIN